MKKELSLSVSGACRPHGTHVCGGYAGSTGARIVDRNGSTALAESRTRDLKNGELMKYLR